MPSWVVGSSPDCDVVVDQPTVSGRHCRVTGAPAGYVVEDLGSTNGTFVNGVRISAPTPVGRSDTVMLGSLAPLPWDRLGSNSPDRVIRIGREPDNDVVLDYPAVSGHHARVVVVDGRATIEDLGSTNGTSLGSPGRPITRAALDRDQTVYFGSFAVPASRLLAAKSPVPAGPPASIRFEGRDLILGRDPGSDVVVDLPMVSGRHARLFRSGSHVLIEDLSSANGTFVNGRRIHGQAAVSDGDRIGVGDWAASLGIGATPPVELEARDDPGPARSGLGLATTAALLAQGPAIAGLIVVAFLARVGGPVDASNWDRAAGGVEGATFAMGLAALWLGASAALGDLASGRPIFLGGRPRGGEIAPKLGLMVVAAIAPSLVLLAIVHGGLGLRGSWPAMFGVLTLAAAVGLALGMIAMAATPSPGLAFAVLAAIFAPMVAIAGAPGFPGESSPAIRLASAVTPARWAYEGLLLAESDARPTLAPPSAEPRDMAERAFPLAERRMGLGACLLALGSMLVGLGGWAYVVMMPAGGGRSGG